MIKLVGSNLTTPVMKEETLTIQRLAVMVVGQRIRAGVQ